MSDAPKKTTRAAASDTSKKTTREEQARATRELLAATALRLFAKQGYAGTSTRQIAKEARVSEGLIFHHFPSKLDLLLNATSHYRILANRIKTLMAGAEREPVGEQVRAVAANFVTMLSPDRPEAKLFQILLGESLTVPELAQLVRQTSDEVNAAVAQYLCARVAVGELRADLAVDAASQSLLGSFLWFFVTHRHLSADAWHTEATAYVAAVVEQWLRGALATPTYS